MSKRKPLLVLGGIALAIPLYLGVQHQAAVTHKADMQHYCGMFQAVADAARSSSVLYRSDRIALDRDAAALGGQVLADENGMDLAEAASSPEDMAPYLARLRADCAIAGYPTS